MAHHDCRTADGSPWPLGCPEAGVFHRHRLDLPVRLRRRSEGDEKLRSEVDGEDAMVSIEGTGKIHHVSWEKSGKVTMSIIQ